MNRIVITVCVALLIGILGCDGMFAQGTAQIVGTVKDPMNTALAGAEITATQVETGLIRRTITDPGGLYVLPNLPIGPYRLQASLPGFRTAALTGVTLHINSENVMDIVLEASPAGAQVEIQANTNMAETRGTGFGQTIENRQILELPLFGRNVNNLILLSGAAVQTGTLNVAGGLGFAAGYDLDGATHLNTYNGQSLPLTFPDTIQELKMETAGLSPEHGQATVVTYLTKSGTSTFHGDLFDFFNNDEFNARPYFAVRKSGMKRNQLGGTLGGPIAKTKLFFFGGAQFTPLRQTPADRLAFVPTAAMLGGDWTGFTSPACNTGRPIALRSPFVNNRVDPSLYSKAAVAIANKLPRATDPCGQLRYSQRDISDEWQALGKMDYQFSESHSLFGRYSAQHVDVPHPFTLAPDNLLNVSALGVDDLAQAFTIGDTYLIGPGTINTFQLATTRLAVNRTAARYFGPADVGINVFSYVPKAVSISVTSGFVLAGQSDFTARTTTYEVRDDLALVRGNHEISFGGDLSHSRTNRNETSAAAFTFNGANTGLALADFLLGQPSTFFVGPPNALYMRQWYVGTYGQDTWKLSRRLTMTYGLRWDPFLPQVSANGRVYNFNYARFQQGIHSRVFQNAPAGFYYPGDPGFPGTSGINKRWLDFAPRMGLAWDVQGNGRTAVRASYGLSYAYLPLVWRNGAGRAAPWALQLSLASPQGGLDNPWSGFPGGDPFPLKFDQNALFPLYAPYLSTPYDMHTTSVSSWNLGIQKQIGADSLISATYLGSQAIHVWIQKPLNNATYFPQNSCVINGLNSVPCSSLANTNQRRRLNLERPQEFIGTLDEFDDGGTQSYNSVVLSVQRRATRAITVSGNYTWSHCIGDIADTNGFGPSAASILTLQDANNRHIDRGNCDSDRRHIFNLSGIAATPRFANNAVRLLATGWRVSGIYRKSSGSYLTITSGIDRALTGASGQRVNQLAGSPYLDKSGRPLTAYLNPAAFALPALGTSGKIGRANIEGPGTWQLDAGVAREFTIRESQRVEFRAEAFNFLNSFRPVNPDTTFGSTIFGQIRSTLAARIMQFALKYAF